MVEFSNVEEAGPVELAVIAVAAVETTSVLEAADANVVGAGVEIVVR